ncbi:MAG: ATP-dependent DNA helicase RecG [Pirellulales bacterium]
MSLPSKSPAELLATPVQYLRGVGPERAVLLNRLGLHTARDLLFYFPRSYEDMSDVRELALLVDGAPVSVVGTVTEVELRNTGPGRTILGVLLRQGEEHLRAVYFNQPYMRDKFRSGQRVMLSGVARRHGLAWEMTHPKIQALHADEQPASGAILPLYGLTEGLSQVTLRRIIGQTLSTHVPLLVETLPPDLLDNCGLWPIHAAVPQVHSPSSRASLQEARRRFIFQELLVMQLALALRRQRLVTGSKAVPLPTNPRIEERIRGVLGVEPTGDQRRAMAEIAQDMAGDVPMNRLLQGDVGTGKTLVAQYALLLTVAHGYQAALMAPTEVLARQHARTLTQALAKSRVRIGLLTGSVAPAERRQLLEQVAAGQLDVVVGTQAVVQAITRSQTQFARLGLVVIDEQHKFGVRQRAVLKQAGWAPHYLVMTATPIPRTVSMTMFGDLDVSTIRESPPGRQAVHTYHVDESRRERWWEFFRRKLREGRQGYVIAPRVDDDEPEEGNEGDEPGESTSPVTGGELVDGWVFPLPDAGVNRSAAEEAGLATAARPLASVERLFEQLTNGPLADFRLDLVHGRMSAAAKEAAMERFRTGETQVLVATAVVEVGVDVPNATLMTIEDGNQFGLAQLHQLRGRVSRGRHPGYVGVFADPRTAESRERLAALVATRDGFALAETDFRLRGPGDLLGTQQHGLPPLRIADLQRDQAILQEARQTAQRLVTSDPDLRAPEWERLRRMVLVRYGEALDLGDVG